MSPLLKLRMKKWKIKNVATIHPTRKLALRQLRAIKASLARRKKT